MHGYIFFISPQLNNNLLRLVVCLFCLWGLSSCNRPDFAARENHDVYLDSIFKLAENNNEKAPAFIDSVYNMLEYPSVKDLYRKYFFLWYINTEIKKDYIEAMKYADSTIGLMREHTYNKEFTSLYARGFFMKGDVYLGQKNYEEAFQYYYKGREVIQNNADSCAVTEFTNRMAMVSYRQKRYKEAIVYYKQSINGHYYCDNISQRYRNEQRNLNNIGLSFTKLGMRDSALYYFDHGIHFIQTHKRFFPGKDLVETALGVIYGNKGDVVYQLGNTAAAEQLYIESIRLNTKKNHDNRDAQFSQIKLAQLYLETGRFDEARELLAGVRKSLDTLKNETAELRWWPLQKRYYDTTHQVEKAYILFQDYQKLRDSLNTNVQLSFFDVNKEFEKIKQQYEFDVLKERSEEKTIYLIITILFLMMVVAILVMTLYNRRRFMRTQKELIEAKNAAEEAAAAKQQFLSNMSHEIRTPMNAVVGMTHLLLQENPRPEQEENLKALKFASENLMVLLNDILDYSKMEAGKMIMEQIDFDLHQLIDQIRTTHEVSALKKHIRLLVEIGSEVPVMLKGDPVRLTQVLNNLLNNAIKFTYQGEVKLALHAEKTAVDMIRLTFRVSDTGMGIAPNHLESIFESFTQASPETTRKFGGTGLGLAITRRLIDLQGGTIQLESKPGKGSTFTISIPFQFGQTLSLQQSEQQTTDVSETTDALTYKVLIVDDNAMNIMVASRLIGRWGITTESATSGAEAIEKLKHQHFDLILMDLQMPEMSGYETCQHIRASSDSGYAHIPILALTADVMPETRERALAAGMNDYISKPFNPDELLKKLMYYLKQA